MDRQTWEGQNFYQTARGRWQRELSEQDLAQVTAIAGELLEELGYDTKGN